MLLALRKGQIAKWFSAWGQEAISVGATLAVPNSVWLFTMHRNLGVFTTRGVPLTPLFAQLLGKETGFTQGRERSFHFGLRDYRIVGMISHVSSNLPVADGLALALRLSNQHEIVVAFTGEGATSEGDFHEALNIASVWRLPVLFIIENNAYAISTPTYEQYALTYFAERARAYGIPFQSIDGNNVLAVMQAVHNARQTILQEGKPFVLECVTFRMRGHEEASGTDYVPQPLRNWWAQRDPVQTFIAFLTKEKLIDPQTISEIRHQLEQQVRTALDEALNAPDPNPQKKHWQSVWAPPNTFPTPLHQLPTYTEPPTTKNSRTLRYVDAIHEALRQAMELDERLILMGQDIAEHGGVFKVTKGFVHQFGKDRVRNTPLCESGIVGVALGLAIGGRPAIVEMQFSDFVSYAMTQITMNLAKIWWRWRQPAPVVIRMPSGAGVRGGPFHSASLEGWFTQVPGLKVVYPATPFDAKGLLLSALADPNPVLYFEHKYLYRSVRGPVPEEPYLVPIGKARIAREGSDLTILTYGWGVHKCLEITEKMGVSAEIIDLRTLLPYDHNTIRASVQKTGKVLIVYEPSLTFGVGAEWSAFIAEELFTYLDAPIRRVASANTPIPFSAPLEDAYLPWNRLPQLIEELLAW